MTACTASAAFACNGAPACDVSGRQHTRQQPRVLSRAAPAAAPAAPARPRRACWGPPRCSAPPAASPPRGPRSPASAPKRLCIVRFPGPRGVSAAAHIGSMCCEKLGSMAWVLLLQGKLSRQQHGLLPAPPAAGCSIQGPLNPRTYLLRRHCIGAGCTCCRRSRADGGTSAPGSPSASSAAAASPAPHTATQNSRNYIRFCIQMKMTRGGWPANAHKHGPSASGAGHLCCKALPSVQRSLLAVTLCITCPYSL